MKSYKLVSLILFISIGFVNIKAQYQIGHTTLTYTNQNGTYTDTVYYPATSPGLNTPLVDDQFPLIVFGNGFQYPISSYRYLIDSLVPCGYILVLHEYNKLIQTSSLEFAENMSFLVDTFLDMNENPASFFYESLNGKSATMGHGLGGNASLIASTLNEQIETLIMLGPTALTPFNGWSPDNPNPIGIAENISKPTLTFGSTNGMLYCGQGTPAEDVMPIYNAIDSTYKTFIEILDGTYCSYTTHTGFVCDASCTSGSEITPQAQQALIIDYTKKWFDIYLKQNCCAFSDFHDCITNSTDISSLSEGDGGCVDDLNLTGIITSDIYSADQTISADGFIEMNSTVLFKAGMETSLLPVFEVELGAELTINQLDCNE